MLSRALVLTVVIGSLAASVAVAGPKQGLGHCKGNGVGHGHHDDDCNEPTPTATGTPIVTPTPAPTSTPIVTPTPTPVPTAPPPAPSGLVWKDATGAVVPRVHIFARAPSLHGGAVVAYKDERGFFWELNPWS